MTTQDQIDESSKQKEKPLGFCSSKVIFVNLAVMCCFWTCAAFNFYLIVFYLKYLNGNIFLNTSMSSIADQIGHLIAGLVMNKFGVKLAFTSFFLVSAAGGILLLSFFNTSDILISIFVLFSKMGISGVFGLVYVATP